MNKGDAFIDKEGTILGFPGHVTIVEYLKDYAIFRVKEKYGIMDFNGNVLFDPEYDKIAAADPFIFLKNNNTWSIRRSDDLIKLKGTYDNLKQLSDDYVCMERNNFWGLLDLDGSIILEIRNNYIKVLFYGETGIVDVSGSWKILPKKANIEILSNNKFLIGSLYRSSIENVNGTEFYSTDNLLTKKDGLYIEKDWRGHVGLVNSKFKKILPVNKDFIKTLIQDSLYIFHDEHGWGTVLESGRILFENDKRFQEVLTESEGFIGVKIDGKYGFVDDRGRLRISNRYEKIGNFQNGMAPVKIIDNWGYVDIFERIMVQPHFDLVSDFKNGLAIESKSEKYGLIDTSGRRITEMEYDSIMRTSNESFILKFGDKYGLADKKGHLKLFPTFESFIDLGNGYIISKRKNKNGFISVNGVMIIPQIYDEIVYDPYSGIYLCGKTSSWVTYSAENLSNKL